MPYNGAISSCIVNGFVRKHFNIKRGVWKGFPLSIVPLSSQKTPIILPCTSRKKLGFADETSFIVANYVSMIECFSIIRIFELATGIKLNNTKPNCLVLDIYRTFGDVL